jgi:hypothetical protein
LLVGEFSGENAQPVRDHFKGGDAKKLLDTIKKYKVTK